MIPENNWYCLSQIIHKDHPLVVQDLKCHHLKTILQRSCILRERAGSLETASAVLGDITLFVTGMKGVLTQAFLPEADAKFLDLRKGSFNVDDLAQSAGIP